MIAEVRKVHRWDGHGMHAVMDVGGKRTGVCYQLTQVRNGQFVDVTDDFVCGRRIDTS